MHARNRVGLFGLIWLIIGIIVALQQGYITISLLGRILAALLAIVLWPLLLLGINLHLG